MPPSDTRTNLRPIEFAMERASDVLPTPGGPRKHRIGPFTSGLSLRTARDSSTPSFPFWDPGVRGVEPLLGAPRVDRFFGALRPGQRAQPVDVGPRHGVFSRRN